MVVPFFVEAGLLLQLPMYSRKHAPFVPINCAAFPEHLWLFAIIEAKL